MEILTPVDKEADEISTQFIAFLVKQATDAAARHPTATPETIAEAQKRELLRLVDIGLKASERHQGRLRTLRLDTAKELRDAGVPMTEIAAEANVNDSYLSRQILADGGKRRIDRTRRRRRRNVPPQSRTA